MTVIRPGAVPSPLAFSPWSGDTGVVAVTCYRVARRRRRLAAGAGIAAGSGAGAGILGHPLLGAVVGIAVLGIAVLGVRRSRRRSCETTDPGFDWGGDFGGVREPRRPRPPRDSAAIALDLPSR